MSDIEAAAEALLLAYERCHHLGSYIDALRSALAHAARGEGERCPTCGSFKRDNACRDAWHDTPPPATGEAGTRGKPFGGYERERAAFDAWWTTVADTAGVPLNEVEERKARLLAWQAFYYRALPEAREGGG